MTPDETYWEHTARSELRLQRCGVCSAWQFPPTSRCATCLSTELSWQPVAGTGTVWSWARLHKDYYPRRDDLIVPYVVAMIQLAEDVRMISTLRDSAGQPLGERAPRCGAAVELMFDPEPVPGQRRLPVFRLLEAAP